jgi:hypothetical protein
MYEYLTKEIIIKFNSNISIDNILNEFGKDRLEAYQIYSNDYYDSRLQIGKYKIPIGTRYIVYFKRYIKEV